MTTKELLVKLRRMRFETSVKGDLILVGRPVSDNLNFYDIAKVNRKKMYDLELLEDIEELRPSEYKNLMQVLVEYSATHWEEREIDKERWVCTHENRALHRLIAKGTILVFIEKVMGEVFLESLEYGRVRVPEEQFSVCYKRMD